MLINVNTLTQEEFDKHLEKIVEYAFREGVLWQKSGGDDFIKMEQAIESAKRNIIYAE